MNYVWESLTTNLKFFWKINKEFDATKLVEEYNEIEKRFKFHPLVVAKGNTSWIHVGLYSAYGDPMNVSPIHFYGATKAEWTYATVHTPYTKECIESLGIELDKVRYSKIIPQGRVYLHPDIGFLSCKKNRLHIPIVTNAETGLKICHETSPRMNPGELWTGDYRFPHYGWNGGEERIHIIIDFKISSSDSEYAPYLYSDQPYRDSVLKEVLASYLENTEKMHPGIRRTVTQYLNKTKGS